VVLFDEVEILDVAGVVQALTLAGRNWNWRPFKILTVAAQAGPIATSNQLRLEASFGFADCPEPELILVPGGYGARRQLENTALETWLVHHAKRAELLCSIGHGTLLLGRAGLLGSEAVAASEQTAPLLKPLAPSATLIKNQRLVIGQKIISAASGESSLDLGLHLVERFLGAGQRRRVQAELQLGNIDEAAASLEIFDSSAGLDDV
jgi:transcriptional regulator GlxA family with amidase domain